MSYVDDDVAEVRARIAAEVREQRELIRELVDGRHRDLDKMREMKALIRELVAALAAMCRGPESLAALGAGREALAKAKAAGYEP